MSSPPHHEPPPPKHESSAPRRESIWRAIERRPIRFIAVLILAAAALIVFQGSRTTRTLVESKALLDAALYADAISEVRTVYTSEVVERVRDQGLLVTHDYEHREGAIPLPATLSMLLGERIGEHGSGASSRLYSPFPFPWRTSGGLRDAFARNAWKHLQKDPEGAFYSFEHTDGSSVLRYARADRMRPACVDCHNSHRDSPKRDWKEGDIRGVLEVRIPMQTIEAQAQEQLRETFALTGAISIIGIGLVWLVVGRLRRTSGELERSITGLRSSHVELTRAHDELVRARDEALAASRSKSEFLSVMSHELKTPLNAIIGYSEILQEDARAAGQEGSMEDLRKIRVAADSLHAQIADILEYSRLDTGSIRPELSELSVQELVSRAVARVDGLGSAEVAFETNVPDTVGAITTDADRLAGAIAALLSNAAKFTERGKIVLSAQRGEHDWLHVSVTDSGIGMSAEQVERLGRPFTQADASSTREYGGIGIGLALARATARLLGGRLDVQSEPDRGSTFTLSIPPRPPEGPDAHESDESSDESSRH